MTTDQPINPQNPPGGKGSRIFKKFCEKFSRLDLTWENDKFTDQGTQAWYEVFITGYMSHPSYGVNRVSIIGKVTDEGVEFAQQPRLHVNFSRAVRECARLTKKFKASFKVFSCMDLDEDLQQKAVRSYEKLMKQRAEDRQRSLDHELQKAQAILRDQTSE